MASAPLLTALQFKKIELHLPGSRRDRRIISAILYRSCTGQSVREAADAFGVTRTKLNSWERALASELPGIMGTLQLEAASSHMQRRGGQSWRRRPDVYERVTALRLKDFRAALRRTSR